MYRTDPVKGIQYTVDEDGEYHSFNGLPAVRSLNKPHFLAWYDHGKLHKGDKQGPALITDTLIQWWNMGQLEFSLITTVRNISEIISYDDKKLSHYDLEINYDDDPTDEVCGGNKYEVFKIRGKYVDNEMHGIWNFDYCYGTNTKLHFHKGSIADGVIKEVTTCGVTHDQIMTKTPYTKGVIDGVIYTYRNNIKLCESTYANNEPSGPYKTFYPDGRIESMGTRKGDHDVGEQVNYSKDGKTKTVVMHGRRGKIMSTETLPLDEKKEPS